MNLLFKLTLDEDGKTGSFQTGSDRQRVLDFCTELIFKSSDNSVSSLFRFQGAVVYPQILSPES